MEYKNVVLDKTGGVLEELLVKDRKALLGEMIQGIIHNINGPLQNIFMATELLKDQLVHHKEFLDNSVHVNKTVIDDVDRQLDRLDHIQEGANSLSIIAQNLIQGVQIEEGDMKTDVNLAIKRLIAVFQNNLFFKHRVETRMDLDKKLPRIEIPLSDFWQSAAHLIKNAIEAMEGVDSEKVLTIRTTYSHDAVHVIFQDTGVGILAEDQEKIFSPFYTTKKVPTGDNGNNSCQPLGLGLYCVKYLLLRHGVRIAVKSSFGNTIISLIIPRKS